GREGKQGPGKASGGRAWEDFSKKRRKLTTKYKNKKKSLPRSSPSAPSKAEPQSHGEAKEAKKRSISHRFTQINTDESMERQKGRENRFHHGERQDNLATDVPQHLLGRL